MKAKEPKTLVLVAKSITERRKSPEIVHPLHYADLQKKFNKLMHKSELHKLEGLKEHLETLSKLQKFKRTGKKTLSSSL